MPDNLKVKQQATLIGHITILYKKKIMFLVNILDLRLAPCVAKFWELPILTLDYDWNTWCNSSMCMWKSFKREVT